jgi:YegS/Rv2252/BmrU family lipid kinase
LKTVAIVNPVAGRRQARRDWPRLLKASGESGSRVVTWWTEGHGHAESLAARARREGFERVLAVGGDGTLFEVANGLWWEPAGVLPSLAVIPQGTGCDYVRNFHLGANPPEHLRTALNEATMPVSAGVFHCRGPGGTGLNRIFLNHLGVGFGADVVARFQRWRLPLQGKLPYYLAGFREMLGLRTFRLRGALDRQPFDTAACLMVAALGQFIGGGMLIAPQASLQARHFQVVWGDFSRLALSGQLARLLAGKPGLHPEIHTAWARKLSLTADPPAPVESGGELVGHTPLEVEVHPEAFQIARPLDAAQSGGRVVG